MHPYKDLPDHCFWRKSISDVVPEQVDPVVRSDFVIKPTDKIATAGSCFAQHIARRLKGEGFNYYISEPAHDVIPLDVAEKHNYGVYSARCGNVYTSRQFLQLIQRAYNLFEPEEEYWTDGDRFIDPFRPQIQPGGFRSLAEFRADRERHFLGVRNAVEKANVFVFTLGLTETWINRADGAAYPLCPGTAGGVYDPSKYSFMNMTANSVAADMVKAIRLMRTKNKRLKFILTVSPVPLVATAVDRSVLVSTVYSKSALRVACEQIVEKCLGVAYFPSYEIITGNYNRGSYYDADLRTVTEDGVSHVMRLFMKYYTNASAQAPKESRVDERVQREAMRKRIVNVICDEEVLAR